MSVSRFARRFAESGTTEEEEGVERSAPDEDREE
jgi:hypothetical protein